MILKASLTSSRWLGRDRLLCDESPDPEGLEFLEAPRESGVIGDQEAQSQMGGGRRRYGRSQGLGEDETLLRVFSHSFAHPRAALA
jgi:hypothetical protein